jgi:predicted KAP-like P-loop ATPase
MTKDATPQLLADRALTDPAADRLGYAPFAKQLARSVLRGCPADGLVVAIYGEWGTGKTTALNFISHYLEADDDAPVIMRFNPWWFAGHEDLVRRFFKQFEATFRKAKSTKRKLLARLATFSALVGEVPDPLVGGAGRAAKAALAAAQTTDVVELKASIAGDLAKDATRMIVVIDDIDRLVADEIRQLFRLIKAVADFPNVIYLLAFDRTVASKAMAEVHGASGDEYLEKIVQVPFTLPPPDRPQLQALLFERLDRILEETPDHLFDLQYWGNVYLDGIDGFIAKPRDVVRFTNALSVTYPGVRGEVHAVDFMALEALRVFCPSAYDVVRTNPTKFAGALPSGDWGKSLRDEERQFHDAWLASIAQSHRASVRNTLFRLFPRLSGIFGNTVYGADFARQWRQSLRACSTEVFPVYFRLSVPAGEVAAAEVKELLARATDASFVGRRLLAYAAEKRVDGHTRATAMLTRLNDEVDRIAGDAVQGLLDALFEVGDDIVKADARPRMLPDLPDDWRIGWVVQGLLKRLPADQRASALTKSFDAGRALSTMVAEVITFGRQHGRWGSGGSPPQERLLTEVEVDALQRLVLNRVYAAATSGALWAAAHPTTLLDVWARWGDVAKMKEHVAARIEDDENLLAFLRLFAGHMHSHGLSDRVPRSELRLDPRRVAEFLDLAELTPRLKRLEHRKGLDPDQRKLLEAFFQGQRAVAQGHDPKWQNDLEE